MSQKETTCNVERRIAMDRERGRETSEAAITWVRSKCPCARCRATMETPRRKKTSAARRSKHTPPPNPLGPMPPESQPAARRAWIAADLERQLERNRRARERRSKRGGRS